MVTVLLQLLCCAALTLFKLLHTTDDTPPHPLELCLYCAAVLKPRTRILKVRPLARQFFTKQAANPASAAKYQKPLRGQVVGRAVAVARVLCMQPVRCYLIISLAQQLHKTYRAVMVAVGCRHHGVPTRWTHCWSHTSNS